MTPARWKNAYENIPKFPVTPPQSVKGLRTAPPTPPYTSAPSASAARLPSVTGKERPSQGSPRPEPPRSDVAEPFPDPAERRAAGRRTLGRSPGPARPSARGAPTGKMARTPEKAGRVPHVAATSAGVSGDCRSVCALRGRREGSERRPCVPSPLYKSGGAPVVGPHSEPAPTQKAPPTPSPCRQPLSLNASRGSSRPG